MSGEKEKRGTWEKSQEGEQEGGERKGRKWRWNVVDIYINTKDVKKRVKRRERKSITLEI